MPLDFSKYFPPEQLKVFNLIAQGWSNKQIAEALGKSNSTVHVQTQQILRKLGIDKRTKLTLIAYGHLKPSRPLKLTKAAQSEERRIKAREMRQNGMSRADIGNRLGVSKKYVDKLY